MEKVHPAQEKKIVQEKALEIAGRIIRAERTLLDRLAKL